MSPCEITPEPGNRFRLRLRCVRACVRAKLRERDASSVARVGRANLLGGVLAPLGQLDELHLASSKLVQNVSKTMGSDLLTSPGLAGLILSRIPCCVCAWGLCCSRSAAPVSVGPARWAPSFVSRVAFSQ